VFAAARVCHEWHTVADAAIYLVRVASFVIILVAIVDKNYAHGSKVMRHVQRLALPPRTLDLT
jgi:hypothetical protein